MARKRDEETKVADGIDCKVCHGRGRHGKNSEVYHVLSFADLDELKRHLRSVFPKTPYCVEFYVQLWVTAHQIYGERARDLQQPLWLVYLEANGVTVKNRGESIMKYRTARP